MDAAKLAILLMDKLAGGLTEGDAALLDAWLNGRPENRELFNRLEDAELLSQDIITYASFDSAHTRQRIDLLLAERHSPGNTWRSTGNQEAVRRRLLLRNAAAVLLLIAASFYFFYSKWDNSTKQAGADQAGIVEKMPPGTNKAVLTLSNGSTVVLDEKSSELIEDDEQHIRNKAGQLTYGEHDGDNVVYNTLSTPKGGQYRIQLPDGTLVWLNSMSAVRYPTVFAGTGRQVEVEGEAYFEVAKDKKRPFIVRGMHDPLKVLVTGTHFNVNTYKDDGPVKVTLLEGGINVSANGDEKKLLPGQQAQTGPRGVRVLHGVDLEEVMAWRYGQFNFGDKADINAVMKQLARWYDFEVEYKGNVSYSFWGSMSRAADGTEILRNLEETGAVRFEIKGKKVIVIPANNQ